MKRLTTSTRRFGFVSRVCVSGLILAAAHSTLGAGQAARPAGATAFEGARLIVGDGSPPIENSVFVVENNHFTLVGTRGQVQVPAGAVRVDLTGKTVIPGLVDLHTHLGYWNYETKSISKENFTRANLVDQLQREAYYGFAAVQSVGDIGDASFKLRDEVVPNGALLRTTGRGLAYPGSGPVGDAAVRNDIPFSVTTVLEGRTGVQEQAARKPNFVKIWVDDRNGTKTKLSPELYGAIIDEAHKQNLNVIAHVFAVADVKGLLKAGVDGFFHGGKDVAVDDELIGLFKAHPRTWLAPGGGGAADAPLTHSNVAKLKAAGVKIVLGTDTQPGPKLLAGMHGLLALEHLVRCGLTPGEAIVAATRDTAELLHLNELGGVAKGKSADFVVLDANPLDNIANTKKISKVYLRGQEVDRAGLRAKWESQHAAFE